MRQFCQIVQRCWGDVKLNYWFETAALCILYVCTVQTQHVLIDRELAN